MMPRIITLLMLLAAPWLAHAQCNPAKPEKFDKFFGAFLKDASFAKKRTRYPLTVSLLERGSSEVRASSISVGEDASSPSLGEFMEANELAFAGVKLAKGSSIVTVFRVDPSWRLAYRFSMDGGCWYLKEIEDRFD